ncbi:MAG: zinc ABC transporter substrate-binding protein [Pseudonocardiales bacterium]
MAIPRSGARALVALGSCCLLALTACGSVTASSHGKVRLVAGENFWGNIAAQIGGDRVTVTSIINDSGADPHEYESTVDDAAAVAQANVVVENGLGYDDFLTKLTSAAPSARRTVLNVGDLVGEHGANPNPHLWYNPADVITAAHAIKNALAKAAPADASTFQANLTKFLSGEQKVVRVVHQIKTKYAGNAVAYTERVPGYLVAAAGLKLATPESFSLSLEDGNDPSPGDNAAFEDALSQHTVRVLIYNAQVSDSATKHLRDLATSAGVAVVSMTEILPSTEANFQTWQAHQASDLLAALGG